MALGNVVELHVHVNTISMLHQHIQFMRAETKRSPLLAGDMIAPLSLRRLPSPCFCTVADGSDAKQKPSNKVLTKAPLM